MARNGENNKSTFDRSEIDFMPGLMESRDSRKTTTWTDLSEFAPGIFDYSSRPFALTWLRALVNASEM